MHTSSIDIFSQKLFDYGTLQLFADTNKTTARLQLGNGAYQLPLSVVVDKNAAFAVYNNSSVNTYNEMVKILSELGAR